MTRGPEATKLSAISPADRILPLLLAHISTFRLTLLRPTSNSRSLKNLTMMFHSSKKFDPSFYQTLCSELFLRALTLHLLKPPPRLWIALSQEPTTQQKEQLDLSERHRTNRQYLKCFLRHCSPHIEELTLHTYRHAQETLAKTVKPTESYGPEWNKDVNFFDEVLSNSNSNEADLPGIRRFANLRVLELSGPLPSSEESRSPCEQETHQFPFTMEMGMFLEQCPALEWLDLYNWGKISPDIIRELYSTVNSQKLPRALLSLVIWDPIENMERDFFRRLEGDVNVLQALAVFQPILKPPKRMNVVRTSP